MSEVPTIEITTPVAEAKVKIRKWITGRDREYIDAPLTTVHATPKVMGKHAAMDMGSMDVNKMLTESDHREIEKFVVEVNGSTENIVDAVLDLPDEDVQFIKAQWKPEDAEDPKKKSGTQNE